MDLVETINDEDIDQVETRRLGRHTDVIMYPDPSFPVERIVSKIYEDDNIIKTGITVSPDSYLMTLNNGAAVDSDMSYLTFTSRLKSNGFDQITKTYESNNTAWFKGRIACGDRRRDGVEPNEYLQGLYDLAVRGNNSYTKKSIDPAVPTLVPFTTHSLDTPIVGRDSSV